MSKRASRKSGNNRRQQMSKRERDAIRIAKVADPTYVERMQGIRGSNAAGIHKGQGEYDRNRKHNGQGWD
jgi:hypothetical protein